MNGQRQVHKPFGLIKGKKYDICGAKKSAMRNGRRLANELAYRAPSDLTFTSNTLLVRLKVKSSVVLCHLPGGSNGTNQGGCY
jgi:hypothetical protein